MSGSALRGTSEPFAASMLSERTRDALWRRPCNEREINPSADATQLASKPYPARARRCSCV